MQHFFFIIKPLISFPVSINKTKQKILYLTHRTLSIQIKLVNYRSPLPQCTRYGASTISLHQRLTALRDPGVSSLLVYPWQFVKFELKLNSINFRINVDDVQPKRKKGKAKKEVLYVRFIYKKFSLCKIMVGYFLLFFKQFPAIK